jgi:hypothetical protein
MDSTKKENFLKKQRESVQKRKSSTVNKENEVPLVNKETEVPSEDDEWLRRNDNYKRQSIHMPFQWQTIIPTGMIATYSCLLCEVALPYRMI